MVGTCFVLSATLINKEHNQRYHNDILQSIGYIPRLFHIFVHWSVMQIYGFFGIRMQDCARYWIYTSEKLNTNRHKAITNMNKFKYLTFAIAMVLPFGLQSCLNDDDDIRDRPTALVTVVPQDGGSFVMNLDDATVLIPTNMSRSPYGDKEVRALVNYIDEDSRASERRVKVVWIDSIRTKMPEKTLGSAAADDEKYGKDPVEIVRDWVTVAEDGYLTLRFRTIWGKRGIKHSLNLVTDTDAKDPYVLELRHNAHKDVDGVMGDALIAFNLNGLDFGDKGTAKFTLKWMSFSGSKSATFELKKRTTSSTPKGMAYSLYVE